MPDQIVGRIEGSIAAGDRSEPLEFSPGSGYASNKDLLAILVTADGDLTLEVRLGGPADDMAALPHLIEEPIEPVTALIGIPMIQGISAGSIRLYNAGVGAVAFVLDAGLEDQ